MPYFGIPIRNGLPIGLGSVAGFGVAPAFSPSGLFAAGEQGAWYDPSDLTTLFQDAAGTTPTVMETRARLMLDKSKGLVLGPELVTNGDFSSGTTGWTQDGNALLSVVGGSLRIENGSALNSAAYQSFATVSNVWYRATIQNTGATNLQVRIGTSAVGSQNYVATVSAGTTSTFYFTATATTTFVTARVLSSTLGAFILLDSISVKEYDGNHATAPSDASSPILRARYNLLQYSEDFGNPVWTLTRLTYSGMTLTETATTGQHLARQDVSAGVGNYVIRCKVKKLSGPDRWITVYPQGAAVAIVVVNLQDGTVASAGGANYVSRTVTVDSDGFINIAVTVNVPTAGSLLFHAYLANSTSAAPSYLGDTSVSVTLSSIDVRLASDAALNIPAYQSITTATSYDTNGFPPYLAFDGTDDSFSTASIDFTGTDKMTVFAGVTKLSDAAQGVVVELSAAIASNNGAFLLAAPDGATQTFGWDSKGTLQVDAVATSQAAPRNAVLTGIGDIGADICTIRVNGAQADTDTGDQGSGNYANAAVFIGRTNNTSAPLNGRIYSLIIRGAATTTPLIQATEQWVAGKMRLPI